MRRGSILFGLALLLAAFSPSVAHAGVSRGWLDRATIDRPDEVSGPQYHLYYVVPADGVDRQLDTTGVVARSFLHFETWLSGQTQGHVLRLDTYQGAPDVTFYRLKESEAQLQGGLSMGPEIAPGALGTEKRYLFYYDATAPVNACGYANSPGRYAVVWLKGKACGGEDPAIIDDYIAGHEAVHETGAVQPGCSAHSDGGGHTTEPTDLMYGGGASGAGWPVLDPGHDDYYGENVPANCFNLASSPLLTTQPLPLVAAVGIVSSGGGTISGGAAGDCTSSCVLYPRIGTPVTFTAVPGPGRKFDGWAPFDPCPDRTGPCTLTPGTADIFLHPTFSFPTPFSVSVNVTGSGAVTLSDGQSCSASCALWVGGPTQVTATATPAAGWHFLSWSGACAASAPCAFTLNAPTTLGAAFRADSHALAVTVTGEGSVDLDGIGSCTSTCAYTVADGRTVALTATPKSGWRFAGWSGACRGLSTCSWTSDQDGRATAVFVQLPTSTIRLTVSRGGSVRVAGLATCAAGKTCAYPGIARGQSVVLTPQPSPGYRFTGWRGACSGLGRCTLQPAKTMSVTAQFDRRAR